MHDTAFEIGKLFLETYGPASSGRILEVGACNVNGTLRGVLGQQVHYIGLDIEPGPSVDVVSPPGASLPFQDGSFDAVLASSVFEHDTAFWITFREMCRVVRPGGWLYVSSPSNGWVHRYPYDCWRFYPDAGRALALASLRDGYPVELVESFVAERNQDVWNDFVAVFRRMGSEGVSVLPARLHLRVPCRNVYDLALGEIKDVTPHSQDMRLLAEANGRVGELQARLDALNDVRSLLDLASSRLAAINGLELKPFAPWNDITFQLNDLLAAAVAMNSQIVVTNLLFREQTYAVDKVLRALSKPTIPSQQSSDYRGNDL